MMAQFPTAMRHPPPLPFERLGRCKWDRTGSVVDGDSLIHFHVVARASIPTDPLHFQGKAYPKRPQVQDFVVANPFFESLLRLLPFRLRCLIEEEFLRQ